MKPKEKKMIIILLIITIIAVILFIITKNKNTETEQKLEGKTNSTQNEYVEKLEDGSKQSISDKLNETKKVGDIEINNIQIKENNGIAVLTANVKNTSATTKNEFP